MDGRAWRATVHGVKESDRTEGPTSTHLGLRELRGWAELSLQGRTQTSGQGAPGSWCSGPGVIIPLSKDTGNLRAASCGWTGRSNNGSTSPCCLWLLARSGRKEAPQPLLLPPALLPGPSRHSGQLSEGITE